MAELVISAPLTLGSHALMMSFVRLSVCSSDTAQVGVLLKRLIAGSLKQRLTIAQIVSRHRKS